MTSSRLRLLALGTGSFIEPETSMTASIRPDWVAIDQLETTRWMAAGSRPPAAVPPFAGAVGAPPAGLGAPCGALKPSPQLPSGARSDCAASRLRKVGLVSSSNSTLAADALLGSMPGSTAYG